MAAPSAGCSFLPFADIADCICCNIFRLVLFALLGERKGLGRGKEGVGKGLGRDQEGVGKGSGRGSAATAAPPLLQCPGIRMDFCCRRPKCSCRDAWPPCFPPPSRRLFSFSRNFPRCFCHFSGVFFPSRRSGAFLPARRYFRYIKPWTWDPCF